MKIILLALFIAAVFATPVPEEDGGAVEMIVNGVAPGEAVELGEIVDIKLKEHADGAVVATDLLHPFSAAGIAEAAAAEESFIPRPEPEGVILPMPVLPEVVIPDPVVLPQPVLPEVVIPDPVVLPQPVLPEVVIPDPVVLPAPVLPEVVIPDPVVLPAPVLPEVVIPDPVVLPAPVLPEVVIPDPVVLPAPVLPEVVIPDPVVLPAPVLPEVEAPEAVILPAPVLPEVVIPEPVVVLPEPVIVDNAVNNDAVSVTVNAEEGVLAAVQSWFSMVVNYFSNDVQSTNQIV